MQQYHGLQRRVRRWGRRLVMDRLRQGQLSITSMWQRSVQECACGSPTNGARLRVISDGRICDRGCVISKLFTADRLAVHSKLLAS